MLLLDEPLSALDLKLRKEMQGELKALQRAVGITFIYVTHDQEEAITLSDRMAVMNAGRIEQEGTPEQVYQRPQTRFVADFIGLTNFIEGTVRAAHRADSADAEVLVTTPVGEIACGGYQPRVAAGDRVTLTLRPERIRLLPAAARTPDGWNTAAGIVAQATFMGPQSEYRISLGSAGEQTLTVRRQNSGDLVSADMHGAGADTSSDTDTERYAFGPGERVTVAWRREASLILREAGSSGNGETREDEHERAGELPWAAQASQTSTV